MRQSWSDDRLDDLNHRVGTGFARVDAQFAHLEERMDAGFNRLDAKIDRKIAELDRKIDGSAAELPQEMKMGFDQINARFDAMQQTMIRVGGGLIGVLAASGAGLIATQL